MRKQKYLNVPMREDILDKLEQDKITTGLSKKRIVSDLLCDRYGLPRVKNDKTNN